MRFVCFFLHRRLFSLEFNIYSCDGHVGLDVDDFISFEFIGKIRSTNTHLHSIDCVLSSVLSLCNQSNLQRIKRISRCDSLDYCIDMAQSKFSTVGSESVSLLEMERNIC